MNKIRHFYRRCREEGMNRSVQIAAHKFRGPMKQKWLRHKYQNYEPKAYADLVLTRPVQAARFFFEPGELSELFRNFKNKYRREAEVTIQIADLICEHKFNWLCPNSTDVNDEIDWHANFFDDRRWPLDFYQDLDYSSPDRIGDVRQIWELNRHQYLVALAKAYWLTGREDYARESATQITDWIEKNPVGFGINWLHSQEVALRAVAWTWVYKFLGSSISFDEIFTSTLLTSIHDHAEYIQWHLSSGPITHNHLVSEACGLALIGLQYPQFKQAKKWRDRGVGIFFREVKKQVWEDGLDGELATSYHCFVLDSFLQLLILLMKNKLDVPSEVLHRIEKMVEATASLLRPDGTLPLVGDCDNGRAFLLTETVPEDRRSYLSTGAALFDRKDLKFVAGRFYEESFWLLGEDGFKHFKRLPAIEPTACDKLFLDGGIASFRESWLINSGFLLVRIGPTRPRTGVATSHNHADLLSFEYCVGGERVLVDPGVYLYGLNDNWRYYYRKTMAHNTIVVDDIDHLNVTTKRFGVVGDLPLSTVHDYRHGKGWSLIDVEHSGYKSYGIRHRRKFLWLKERMLIIVDSVSGEGHHSVKQYYHFPSEITLQQNGTFFKVIGRDGQLLTNLSLIKAAQIGCQFNIQKGCLDEIQGWVSDRYAQKKPACVINTHYAGELPIELISVFGPTGNVHEGQIEELMSTYHIG